MHVNKKLGIVEGSAVDITEQKNNLAMAQNYADQLSVVNQIVRVISGSNDIKDIYNVFVDQMHRLMDFDRTSIVGFDDSRENWTVVMGWNRNKAFIPQGISHPIRGSITEIIRDNGKPLLENNIGDLGEWPENSLLLKEGIQSRLLMPLKIEGIVRGFLTLASGVPGQFKERDLEIVQMIADHLAIAQQKSGLFDQVIKHADDLESKVKLRTSELESANKEMEEFTYTVSHDLRAPLRHISGYENLLTENYHASLPEKAQHYLGAISQSIKSMGVLIDDLLQFSRSRKMELRHLKIELNSMISEIVEQLTLENANRIIEWIIPPLPGVKGDPVMLGMVWMNLFRQCRKIYRQESGSQD